MATSKEVKKRRKKKKQQGEALDVGTITIEEITIEEEDNFLPDLRKRTLMQGSDSESEFGGVCAGIANYTGINLTLVRVLTFLGIWFGGSGFFIYCVLWFCLPSYDEAKDHRLIGHKKKKEIGYSEES